MVNLPAHLSTVHKLRKSDSQFSQYVTAHKEQYKEVVKKRKREDDENDNDDEIVEDTEDGPAQKKVAV